MMLVTSVAALAFFEQGLVAPSTARRASQVPRMQYDSATFKPEIGGLNPQDADGGESGSRPDGAHGTGSRFMPLTTISKESSPAVVCIAGVYPGLTADQLSAPQPVPFAPPGKWNYHMLRGDSAPGGFVAIPGSYLLDTHPDTVAVVCQSGALGIEFPDNNEHEVLALIDRNDYATEDPTDINDQAFYAFADPAGTVHIRWIKELPAGWRVVGKLIYAQMPFVKKPGASSGFAENSDDFEF